MLLRHGCEENLSFPDCHDILYLLIHISLYSSKWLFLRAIISFQQNVSESEAFLIIELKNIHTFIALNPLRCKMYTNIIRTNKWLLSNRADPDFDRIDERVTPQKKNANKILNNPPIYRLSNFKLSTGLPWLERARVEQNTWENNDLTKDRVSTSSSLPVDCLTNLTRAQPPTLRSNFQQNGARRERVEGKGYFVWLGEKRRERKKERKTKERRGEKMAKSVRSRGSFSVTRASRWNGEQEKPQDRCGGREGLSRPISLSIGSPFAVLAIRKFQIRNCTNVWPGWLSSCNENRSVLFGQGKGYPLSVFSLSYFTSLSLSLCRSALGVRSNVPR